MRPPWMQTKTQKSTDQLIAEERAARATRRSERMKESEHFARALAREMRQDANDNHSFRAPANPIDMAAVRLRKELANHGMISESAAASLPPEQRSFIDKINQQVRRLSAEDENSPSTISGWLASEMQQSLRAAGFDVSLEHLQHLREKSLSASNHIKNNSITFEPLSNYEETVRLMKECGVNITERELRSFDENRRRYAELKQAGRKRYSANAPRWVSNAPVTKRAVTKPSDRVTRKPVIDIAEIYARRRQAPEKHG